MQRPEFHSIELRASLRNTTFRFIIHEAEHKHQLMLTLAQMFHWPNAETDLSEAEQALLETQIIKAMARLLLAHGANPTLSIGVPRYDGGVLFKVNFSWYDFELQAPISHMSTGASRYN